jgi:hypothetical protein
MQVHNDHVCFGASFARFLCEAFVTNWTILSARAFVAAN